MLNLFQHLIKSNSYETLKRLQGDRLANATPSSGERGYLSLLCNHHILYLNILILQFV